MDENSNLPTPNPLSKAGNGISVYQESPGISPIRPYNRLDNDAAASNLAPLKVPSKEALRTVAATKDTSPDRTGEGPSNN